MPEQISLRAVDAVEITVLVDNSTDVLLPSTPLAQRAAHPWDAFERAPLLAEHGYALWLTVRQAGHPATLLYDAGLGHNTLLHNMDVLGLAATDIQAIVLSHGHTDHHGGLVPFLERLGRRRVPLVLHPAAWRDRKTVLPTGDPIHLAPPDRPALEHAGAQIIEAPTPSLLLDNTVLVTGRVERVTDFEKGIGTMHQANIEGTWQVDTEIPDDQAIVCHVQGKGLVVLSGCSHSGIVNIVQYAQRLTGVNQVYAIIGGFHLAGKSAESLVAHTLDALAAMQPTLVVPGHCTGWKAVTAIANKMPAAYVPSSVGTRLHLEK